MKKIKLFICIFTFLIVFLPFKVFANDSDWILVESGSKSIKSEEVNSFEESLKQKVKDLQEKDHNYIYRYSLEKVNTEIKEDTSEKKNINVIEVNEKFDSEEDAINYYNNINIEYSLHKGNYLITPYKLIKEIKGKENVITCTSVNCTDEINRLKQEEYLNSKLVYEVSFTNQILNENSEYFYYYEDGKLKLFNSKEEANKFINNNTFNKDGYKFIGTEIEEEIITSKYEENFSKTYSSLKEAQDALAKLKEEYEVTNDKITPIRNADKDINTILNEEIFENEIDAQNKVNELNNDKTYEYEITAKYIKDTKKINENTKVEDYLNGLYTKKELQEAIKNLENDGWIIDSKTLETISYITGKVTSTIKVDESKTKYIINSDNNYVLIKQAAKGTVAVWTENELSSEAKDEFAKTYKSVTTDGSTSGDLEITFIYGFNTFDLSGLGNGWGKDYTFSKDQNNNIILTIPSKAVSHIVYGYAEESTQKYKITGLMHKEIVKYIVKANKLAYGFDYKLDALIQKYLEEKKYKIKIIYKKINQESKYELKYRYDEITEETYYKLSYETYNYDLINYDNINYIIEKIDNGIGNINNDNENEILPPHTKVNSSFYILLILVNTLGISVLLKKQEN
ncbi:MAG: hypothetical protein ACI4XR_00350 [Bacilli bacterium]